MALRIKNKSNKKKKGKLLIKKSRNRSIKELSVKNALGKLRKYVTLNKSAIISAEYLIEIGINKSLLKEEEICLGKVTLHNQNNGTYFIHY